MEPRNFLHVTKERCRAKETLHLSDKRSPLALSKLQARERTSDLVFAGDEGRQLVRDAALAHGVLVLPVHAQLLQKHDRPAHTAWRVSGIWSFWEISAALELGQALQTAREEKERPRKGNEKGL